METSAEFLERGGELELLGDCLLGIRRGSRGRLLLVGGEAGVGKTTLLRRFCNEGAGDARILWGACDPLFTPRPMGPLLDVAERTGGELEELVECGARPHEVTAALMRELRKSAPTVLVLEDVHAADEATLDVLRLLARRVGETPVLVIASYREQELTRTHPLRIVLGELPTDAAQRVNVSPLSAAAVATLAIPLGVDADELYRKTSGNPFFVTEVLASGVDEIPDTIRDAVLARASRLSPGGRTLLDAVAAIPPHAELWLLEALADDVVDRLEECLSSGMLAKVSGGVAFRHELARLAVEESLAPDRRVVLHRRALAALAEPPIGAPDAARLAHHAEAAGDVEGVRTWAPRAAERAAVSGAHREAAAQYARALKFADASSVEERAELYARRADECYMTSQMEEAIAAQERALECRRQLGDLRGEGDALRSLSRLLFFAGRTDEGEPIALEAVELLEGFPASHELAMAYGNLSQRQMVTEHVDAAVAWGARALELAERIDDIEALVYALTNLGAAEAIADAAQGRSKLQRALALALRHGLEEHAGRVFFSLVFLALRQRRFELVGSYLDEGLVYCTERGLDTWRLYLLAARARLELMVGAWDAAADSAALVLRDPRSAPVARQWGLTVLGLLRARRGDPGGTGALEEAHALGKATNELTRIAPTAAARAELAWLTGDPAAVQEATDAALALALDRRAPWAVGELTYWRGLAGIRDELPAELVAEPYRLAIAGDWRSAAQLWTEIGCPYEAALAAAESDDDVTVRQAIVRLQRLGAAPAAAIVARRLRKRGVRGVPRGPRPRTRTNPAGLTARQLEVLELLARGSRNAEIAERLVLSERTVEHHVSAILRKLGVETRAQAAAEAVRLALAGQAK